ncbi:MAG TPA: aminotransferase class IV [Streptosporangiaceae bacterium]|nr:aminotransferase class IV [Streptosporangiaceae bacterium]
MPVWINGELLPDSEARISVFDHGLVVGDGVFETVKVASGQPFALTRHLARLSASAVGLGLPAPDLDQISSGVAAVVGAYPGIALARLRITVTAGLAPLGSERGNSSLTAVIALAEQRPPTDVVDVAVVPWTRNERGAVTGLKTISYAENVRALAYAAERGAAEAIFANTAGNLCEGTGTNIFVVRGGRLVTPPLPAGCLAGVTRALVIEWAGVAEEDVPIGALAAADEAFLTGTTRDVQPIRKVNGSLLPVAPGPVTRKVADAFGMRAAESPDP